MKSLLIMITKCVLTFWVHYTSGEKKEKVKKVRIDGYGLDFSVGNTHKTIWYLIHLE
ncbi:hypothetical protein KAW48_01770 [candidate division WOR-3 bacterium]|nr:hypothetical protein [candidate division WOR-3 bacterium]